MPRMHFSQIDQIVGLTPHAVIRATKTLSMAEEYLKDHFPEFAVMPGVLMLEAMYQASAWLLRHSDDFAYSTVVMQEVPSVRFADFVRPGQVLTVTSHLEKREARRAWFRSEGTVDGRTAVTARLILDCFNLADQDNQLWTIDAYARRELRQQFSQLCQPSLQ